MARTLPAEVVAATGKDVVCHAAEYYLARPYTSRERPASPADRPPYQGSNPVADVWSAKALEYGGKSLRRAVADGDDVEARGAMMLAASMAGVGFGSAGVHIPHACAYPIAGLKHEYDPPGYPGRFIPHGISVIVTAPAAFAFTYDSSPERHDHVTALLGGPIADLMRDLGVPTLSELGYSEDDIPELVEGALAQQRLLAVAPREVTADDLAGILRASM